MLPEGCITEATQRKKNILLA